MGIFNIDSGFNRALARIADMVLLSFYWLICCLPIVTIGASTTALYYACMKSHLEEGTNTRNFFHAFIRDLKQSLVLELIVIGVAAMLVVDLYILPQMNIPLGGVVQVILTVTAIIGIAMLSYLFPLLARFENTMLQRLRNALLMSLMNFHYTLIILVVNCAPLLVMLLLPDLFIAGIPVFVLVWPGAAALINAKIFLKIFAKYEPEPETAEKEEQAV